MSIEKRGQSYRVRKMFNGKSYSKTFDHRPTEKEIIKAFSQVSEPTHYGKKTFEKATKEYLNDQKTILSPSTLKGYKSASKMVSERFNKLLIDNITAIDIQRQIKEWNVDKAPKTVRNYYCFIRSVLGYYRPDFVFKVNLPQAIKYQAKIPTQEAVGLLIKKLDGTKYSIPLKLSLLGLRRGEIMGLEKSDLVGNELYIHSTKVLNENNELVKRNKTKNVTSTRTIYVPDSLAKEIRECEKIWNIPPCELNRKIQKTLIDLGFEPCREHDLRHYYVSYAHNQGMSDADIMASVGHKTDYIMKNVYRHSIQISREEKQKEIATNIFG